MTKRLSALMGLSIVAVVLSHAIAFTDYMQLSEGIWYYACLVVMQSIIWAIPAFLFSSGYFAGYALARSDTATSWAFVSRRIFGLAIPYLIWHVTFLTVDALRGVTYPPVEWVRMIVTGMDYYSTFYFIPLLIQLYLLAPFLAKAARRRPGTLLIGCGVIQLISVLGRWYLHVLAPANGALYGIPGAYHLATVVEPLYMPFMWATFFPLGIVFHIHAKAVRTYLSDHRTRLLLQASAGVLWLLGIAIAVLLHQSRAVLWVGIPFTAVSGLCATAIIVLFVTRSTKLGHPLIFISKLVPATLGIYLLNVRAMQYFRLLFSEVGVEMTSWPPLIPFVLFYTVGIGLPLLLMYAVARTPLARAQRYLFG
jgi:hypothetical protein